MNARESRRPRGVASRGARRWVAGPTQVPMPVTVVTAAICLPFLLLCCRSAWSGCVADCLRGHGGVTATCVGQAPSRGPDPIRPLGRTPVRASNQNGCSVLSSGRQLSLACLRVIWEDRPVVEGVKRDGAVALWLGFAGLAGAFTTAAAHVSIALTGWPRVVGIVAVAMFTDDFRIRAALAHASHYERWPFSTTAALSRSDFDGSAP